MPILDFDNAKDFYLTLLENADLSEMERDYVEKRVMQLSEEEGND